MQDESGSLWLTAFVLSTFSNAREVRTIDETVLSQAAQWISAINVLMVPGIRSVS
jgi:CD109 antigen